jgi:hypothetical protein
VRVKVATLGVNVAERDSRTDGNIWNRGGRISRRSKRKKSEKGRTGERILHPMTLKRVLELGAHEPISFSRVAEDGEMNRKHRHVKSDGDTDKADPPRDEVTYEERNGDPQVAEEEPELDDGVDSDGGNGEESDPLARDDRSESESGQGEPDPPPAGERSDPSSSIPLEVVLVGEPDPEKDGEGGEEDQGRVEEDEPRLGDESVLEQDEGGSEECRGGTELESAEGEVGEGNEGESKGGREETHGDVGDVIGTVLAADVFEVEGTAFETGEPGDEGDGP